MGKRLAVMALTAAWSAPSRGARPRNRWRRLGRLAVAASLSGSTWLAVGVPSALTLGAPTGVKADQRPSRTNELYIHNQGMANHVRVSLDFALDGPVPPGQAPSEADLMAAMACWLGQRPMHHEYWEALSASLVRQLMHQYEQLQYISLSLEVPPQSPIPYHRTSTVSHWANGQMQEQWSFIAGDIPIQSQQLHARVSYVYRQNSRYFDFLELHARMVDYLHRWDGLDLSVAQLEIHLTEHLMRDYGGLLSTITVELDQM